MTEYTRRHFLKTGLAVSAGSYPVLAKAAPWSPEASAAAKASAPTNESPRERLLMDFDWQFRLGNADDPSLDFEFGRWDRELSKTGELFSPSRLDFDDAGWRTLDLPHDWAVELPFVEDSWLIATAHGSKPVGRIYPATSIGWYRRVFEIPEADRGRRLSIEFDGVFRDCMVALNGNLLGRNMSGYAPARYDITDHALYGKKNVLVVRVDATLYEGWFYEGAGIYRHTWLVKTSPLHVAHWGTFVASEVSGGAATLTLSTEVENEADSAQDFQVVSAIADAEGRTVATERTARLSIPAWGRRAIKQSVTLRDPHLWSIEDPHLYRLLTTLQRAGVVSDRYETRFGIRTIRFDAAKGFFLNGKPVKIKGTCNHQDHAGVGTALPDRLQSYRIEKLKAMGSNAYRTSHNPPTPELLDACDRLGMLVLDETRMFSSCPEGLSQLGRMVRRDRNHPCIILWSTGNEEPEQGSGRGARICETMKRLVRRLDPTRLITQAMNNDWGKGISQVVDVQGFNYHHADQIDAYHRQFPHQPEIGTEVGSTVSTRGIYANNKEKGYVSAYDVNYPRWATTAEEWWQMYDARPFLSGGFVWTGFDYRGEPTPYGWPCISSHFGIMDTCGFPKDNYYYYQAWWSDKPVLHLLPHWNWAGKESQEIAVWCYSNLDSVELFLNGQSLGAQDMPRNSHVAWKVKYVPGAIEVHGYKNGKQVLTHKRETTGAAAKILLRPDRQRIRADREDVTVIAARVVDSQNRLVPVADNEIAFQVSGPGRIIGVGNGDPSSHEADKAQRRRAFNGLCVAIVQSTEQAGEIRFFAESPGLQAASVVILSQETTPRPAVPGVPGR